MSLSVHVSFFFLKHSKKTSNASVLSGRYLNEARPSTTSSALSINLDEDGSPEILQLQCDTISLLLKVYNIGKLLYIYKCLTCGVV